MNKGAAIGLGAALLTMIVVVGSGGRSKAKPTGKDKGKLNIPPTPTPTPKPDKEFPVVPKAPDTGLTIGLGCTVVLTDINRAREVAYNIGKTAATFDAAEHQLYNFGDCGFGEPLKVATAAKTDFYRIQWELWRGAIKGGTLTRAEADKKVMATKLEFALSGISFKGLPEAFPP